jgi:hypothetical protein
MKDMSFEEATKVCYDYTVNGLSNMVPVANKPFRFIYTSGVTVERDQTKTLSFLQDYRLMRVSCQKLITIVAITSYQRAASKMPFPRSCYK